MRIILLLVLLLVPIAFAGSYDTFGWNAYIRENNAGINGEYNISFDIYNVSLGGVSLWNQTKNITISTGILNTEIENVTIDVFNQSDLYLQVNISSTARRFKWDIKQSARSNSSYDLEPNAVAKDGLRIIGLLNATNSLDGFNNKITLLPPNITGLNNSHFHDASNISGGNLSIGYLTNTNNITTGNITISGTTTSTGLINAVAGIRTGDHANAASGGDIHIKRTGTNAGVMYFQNLNYILSAGTLFNEMRFGTNGLYRMYLTDAGRLGIGMPPSTKYGLTVAGNVNASAYVTNGTDYAEFVDKLSIAENITSGNIVGIYNGKATKNTTNANSFMVVSGTSAGFIGGSNPIFDEIIKEEIGEGINGNPTKWNKTFYTVKSDYTNYNVIPIAFAGQIRAKITGTCNAGDWVIPSGNNDGYGKCIDIESVNFPQVNLYMKQKIGVAWESSVDANVKLLNIKVG